MIMIDNQIIIDNQINERQKIKVEKSTLLGYTGLIWELQHLNKLIRKTETRVLPTCSLKFRENTERWKWNSPVLYYTRWTPEDVKKWSVSRWVCKLFVYYESRKWELKTRPMYECRSDERLKTELLFMMNRESESWRQKLKVSCLWKCWWFYYNRIKKSRELTRTRENWGVPVPFLRQTCYLLFIMNQ